jgi:hypothetical protein
MKAEAHAKERAEYGAALLRNLSIRLTQEFAKGFTETNLKYFRQFYLAFPAQTASGIGHTLCDQLTWSHYNYILKCFVLVDLKTGELTHQDIGEMDMYVRLFEDTIKSADDNPTVGIILCTEKDHTVVKYSVLNENRQLFASKYMLYLPTEEALRQELERERALVVRE